MQFWQICRNFFATSPKNSSSNCKSKNKNIIFSKKNISSKYSRGQVECTFDNFTNFFVSSYKKVGFYWKNLIFSKIVWGGKFAVAFVSKTFFLENVLSTLLVNFCNKSESIWFWKNHKRVFFLKKPFHPFQKAILSKLVGWKMHSCLTSTTISQWFFRCGDKLDLYIKILVNHSRKK